MSSQSTNTEEEDGSNKRMETAKNLTLPSKKATSAPDNLTSLAKPIEERSASRRKKRWSLSPGVVLNFPQHSPSSSTSTTPKSARDKVHSPHQDHSSETSTTTEEFKSTRNTKRRSMTFSKQELGSILAGGSLRKRKKNRQRSPLRAAGEEDKGKERGRGRNRKKWKRKKKKKSQRYQYVDEKKPNTGEKKKNKKLVLKHSNSTSPREWLNEQRKKWRLSAPELISPRDEKNSPPETSPKTGGRSESVSPR